MLPTIEDFGGEAFQIRRYAIEGSPLWSAFNPSIAKTENGEYWCVFRASNYYFTKEYAISLTVGKKVYNRMFIGRLSPTTLLFDETTIKEIDTRSIRNDIERGIEDARLYFDGKQWCISATFLEASVPVARICKIQIKSLENPEVSSIDIYPAPEEKRVEKNWMPINQKPTLLKPKDEYLYDTNTFYSKGKHKNLNESLPEALRANLSHFRGGSQVIPIGDSTQICVIHEVYEKTIYGFSPTTFTNQRQIRRYSHRFLRLDNNYNLIQMSDKFVFMSEGIEFASGIASYKDGFAISFGKQDITSNIATISLGNLLLKMKDVS